MRNILVSYNFTAKQRKLVSHILYYPDGIERVLTMQSYKWDWVTQAEENGYPFNDILDAAITLACESPTGKGYQYDVLYRTEYMLLTIVEMIYEENIFVSNQL